MNEKKGTFQRLARKLACKMIEKDHDEWPPRCIGPLYQPLRPFQQTPVHTEADKISSSDHPQREL